MLSDGSHYEKRGKGEPVCIDDEIPFEIPESWEWARLESCCRTVIDCPHSTPTYLTVDTGFYAIDTNCMDEAWRQTGLRCLSEDSYRKRVTRYVPRPGDLVLSREGSIGRSVILRQENVCLGQRVMVLGFFEDGLLNQYCQLVLTSPYAWGLYLAANVGTGVKHINVSMIKEILIPLPPKREQVSVIEMIDKLEPIIDQYGILEDARERLDAELPDRLRKSILQLAVQGRLVEQDPADEPASALLERIRAERARLVKEKRVRAPKGGESVIWRASDGGYYEKRGKGEPQPIEVPFDVPSSWEWVRVSSVFNLVRGSGIKRSEVTISGEPCVRYGELYTTYQTEISTVASYTNRDVFDRAQKLLNGEVVATLTGENDIDIGRSVINNTGETIAFGGDLLALKGNYIDGDFAMLCMNSPYMGLQRTAAASGNIIVHLSADKFGGFLMAIPPADEQKRIATRCKKLLATIR